MGKCITDANLGINLDINLDTLEMNNVDKVQLDEFIEFSEYEDSESNDSDFVDSSDDGSKKTCVTSKTTKCKLAAKNSSDGSTKILKKTCVATKTAKTKRKNTAKNTKTCPKKRRIELAEKDCDSDITTVKQRTKWSDQENKIINEHFANYVLQKIIPPKSLIDTILPLLPGRTYRNVKDKVRNSFAKK